MGLMHVMHPNFSKVRFSGKLLDLLNPLFARRTACAEDFDQDPSLISRSHVFTSILRFITL
jgi:hypothetical protein